MYFCPVYANKRFFILFALIHFSLAGYTQIIDVEEQNREEDRRGSAIIDDSTRQVYGPTSTLYTYEPFIKYNKLKAFTIDTTITNFHRFHYVPWSEFTYQDLGNIGTALNSIFPKFSSEIGVMPGIITYDPYFKKPDEIRYYNTLSAHSRFKIIWGGQGRAFTEANFARNINERINFGFEFKGYYVDKQINRQGRGDRQAQGVYYHLHGSFVSKNRNYVALAYFNRNRHEVEELGGIRTDTNDPEDEGFFAPNRRGILTNAETIDLRTNYHLYHQFRLNKVIQLYHSFDRYKQLNKFNYDGNDGYYEINVVDSANSRDEVKYVLYANEVGVKGDIGKTFYNFYYKIRDSRMDYKYRNDASRIENFAGANLRFGNDSLSFIEAYAEFELKGNYRIGGRIENTWFHAEAESMQSAPTYMQEAYRGSFHEWNNDFSSPITTRFSGGFNFDWDKFALRPGAGYSLHSSYIYFERFLNQDGFYDIKPFQTAGDISVLYGEAEFSLTFLKRMNLTSRFRWSNVSGSSAQAIRIPELFSLTQLSYNNLIFNGNLDLHTGIDFHWRSDYYAMGYDPAITQYHIQDEFESYNYPLVDVFINARVNRGRLFLKLNNVMELILDRGYFATPYYPGQETILDFGIDWIFFD